MSDGRGSEKSPGRNLLDSPSVQRLASGRLSAVFLPDHGMLCASLRDRGAELLRRLEDLETAAAKGSTAGIPLLYPWANRLAAPDYRAGGKEVQLDPSSSLLHLDSNGLPMHGVPWATLGWELVETRKEALEARLEWTRADLLEIFPFPHQVEIRATLDENALTMETTVAAAAAGPVPVSFGFHPYFGIPEQPRAGWRVTLPAMRRLVLDQYGIPTGREESFAGFDSALAEHNFDDCFATIDAQPTFSIESADRRLTVEFLEGYGYAQVFAPNDKDYIAIEPMTAPTNALRSGVGLHTVSGGSEYRAVFRVTTSTGFSLST
jgi:aldose 1-epimerase